MGYAVCWVNNEEYVAGCVDYAEYAVGWVNNVEHTVGLVNSAEYAVGWVPFFFLGDGTSS